MNNILNKNIRKIVFIFATFLILSNILKVQLYASENSINYIIEDKYITRVLPETTVEIFKNKLAKENIEITNKNGEILNDTDIIVTGTNVKIEESLYKVSVIGDINGDGKVTNEDVIKGEKYFINIDKIENEYLKSIDINNDGKYTITDLVQMNLIASSEKKIEDFIKNDFKEEPLLGMLEKEYDPDGDEDGDGLTNAEEEALGTNMYEPDSDYDGIIDSDEVNILYTNPLIADTDGDGINDGDEVALGLDPLKEDSKGDGTKDSERELTYTIKNDEIGVSLEILGKGNIASSNVDVIESNNFASTQGIIDKIYNFNTSGELESARVEIKYDMNELEKNGLNENNLTLYYLNKNTKEIEKIQTVVDKENKLVKATLNHFSPYFIGDDGFEAIFWEDIIKNKWGEDWVDYDGDGVFDGYRRANSGFLPEVNGFSFENYGTVQSSGGNCAGMAKFAMLYYMKQLPISMGYIDVSKEAQKKYLNSSDTTWYSNGYDLSDTYFVGNKNLYDYKITNKELSMLINEDIVTDYRDRVEDETFMIKKEYYDKLLEIGAKSYNIEYKGNYEGADFTKYQKALLDIENENFNTNVVKNESQLMQAIFRLYVTQVLDETYDLNSVTNSNVDENFNKLITKLNDRIPVVFSFRVPNIGSHAVNAIQLIDDMDDVNKFKIAIYDNNYPGEIRYVECTRHKNKFLAGWWAESVYWYSFEYDWNNDGEIDKIEGVHIAFPEEKDEIYASLYDDGTLAFTAKNETLKGKTLIKSYGDISYKEFKDYEDVPWYSDRESITNVDIIDKISPVSTAFWFARCYEVTEIKNISNLDTSNVTDMSRMFDSCESLTTLDVSKFDTSNVTDMSRMFDSCESLTTLDVSKFDTSNVTNMSDMFCACNSLTTLDVSKFDTSNVTDMSWMFGYCRNLTILDVSKLDTSNVTNMSGMFEVCKSLTTLDVSKLDTSNVTNMSAMFEGCESLTTLDVSKFDTSNATYMKYMFYGCEKLTNLDVSKFDTSNVTDMRWMFTSCRSLITLDVSKFDTSNVTDMSEMFAFCGSLTTLDVSKFDTSNVTDVSEMFASCGSLTTLDVSKFDTSNVTDMSWMFTSCRSLITLDVSKFDTSNVTDMSWMFYACYSLTSLDLSKFDTSNVTDMSYMFMYTGNLTIIYVGPNWQISDNTDIRWMFDYCGTQEVTRK